jgi:hypothetical protein
MIYNHRKLKNELKKESELSPSIIIASIIYCNLAKSINAYPNLEDKWYTAMYKRQIEIIKNKNIDKSVKDYPKIIKHKIDSITKQLEDKLKLLNKKVTIHYLSIKINIRNITF